MDVDLGPVPRFALHLLQPDMPTSNITLYAELLLHIRTITIFASLRSFHNHETKAELSADGSSVTVSHEGESATIRLPINAKVGGDAALTLPAHPPSKEITLRLQIEEKEGSKGGTELPPPSGMSQAPDVEEIGTWQVSGRICLQLMRSIT